MDADTLQRYDSFCKAAEQLLERAGYSQANQESRLIGQAFYDRCMSLAQLHFPRDKKGGTGPVGLLHNMWRSFVKSDPNPEASVEVAELLKEICANRPDPDEPRLTSKDVPNPAAATALKFDVFMSYAADDSKLATEIKEELEDMKLKVFLAEKSIKAGSLWKEAVRNALWSSRVAVLLLTPKSVSSQWVMAEAGAFWALEKPLAPALVSVDTGNLPELITQHQCMDIVPAKGRKEFLDEVKRLC